MNLKGQEQPSSYEIQLLPQEEDRQLTVNDILVTFHNQGSLESIRETIRTDLSPKQQGLLVLSAKMLEIIESIEHISNPKEGIADTLEMLLSVAEQTTEYPQLRLIIEKDNDPTTPGRDRENNPYTIIKNYYLAAQHPNTTDSEIEGRIQSGKLGKHLMDLCQMANIDQTKFNEIKRAVTIVNSNNHV